MDISVVSESIVVGFLALVVRLDEIAVVSCTVIFVVNGASDEGNLLVISSATLLVEWRVVNFSVDVSASTRVPAAVKLFVDLNMLL